MNVNNYTQGKLVYYILHTYITLHFLSSTSIWQIYSYF